MPILRKMSNPQILEGFPVDLFEGGIAQMGSNGLILSVF